MSRIRKASERASKGRRPRQIGPGSPAWDQQEEKSKKTFRGKRTRGSGSGRQKGDVFNDSFLNENKTTSKDSISVKRSVLAKIAAEARAVGKTFALTVGFDKGVPNTDSDFVMLAEQDFEALMMAAECASAGDLKQAQEWAEQVIKRE